MKKYSNPQEPLPLLITDKTVLALTLKSISYTLRARQAWNQRMDNVLSSRSCENFRSYTHGVETQLRVAELEQANLIQIRMSVQEAASIKATNRMYTTGKGPIKVKDAKVEVAKKIAQRRPKKQVEHEFIINVKEGDEEGDNDDANIYLELRELVFGDVVPDPFLAQHDVIEF
jgi:hypothetical protein